MCSVPVLTSAASPIGPARSSQAARTRANPAPLCQTSSQLCTAAANAASIASGVTSTPCALRCVAARSISVGCQARLMPMPITIVTSASSALPMLSGRMPAHLAVPISTSLGHFNRRPAMRTPPAAARIASITATPASSETCATAGLGHSMVCSRLAYRLPGSEPQRRPERPRPCVWRRATIHNGPRSPTSARLNASVLVEPTSSRTTLRTDCATWLASDLTSELIQNRLLAAASAELTNGAGQTT
jgi:hypothetical protein